VNNNAIYRNGEDHLADELAWLDAGLQTLLDIDGGNPFTDPLTSMRGLVVTEEELRRAEEHPDTVPIWSSYIQFRREQERRNAVLVRESLKSGISLPLAHIVHTLQLSIWECRCLVLCLAAEWNRKYEKWFAYLNDDVTCPTATSDLALRLLCDTEEDRQFGRARLSGDGVLRRLLLESLDNEATPASNRSRLKAPLRLDDRTVSYLLETERIDARLAGVVSAYEDEDGHGQQPEKSADHYSQTLNSLVAGSASLGVSFIYLWGPIGGGKHSRLRRLAASRKQRLLTVDTDLLPHDPEPLKLMLSRIIREAALTDAALCFVEKDGLLLGAATQKAVFTAAFRDYLEFVRRPLLLWTSRRQRRRTELPVPEAATFQEMNIGVPDAHIRTAIWGQLAGELKAAAAVIGLPADENTSTTAADANRPLSSIAVELGDKFRFTPGQIASTWKHSLILAAARGESKPSREDLVVSSRIQFNHRLAELADLIQPNRTWEDLILPPESLSLIKEACNRFKLRETVLGRWGFGRKLPYGTGIHMLFAGPPGTGKTMAAEIVARELDLELYRIDLSRIVSKYIGETEQRLRDLFEEAQQSGAILFFDEGDALFGKRTEVKDAHDRYANMEAAYLLQRIEAYDGVTILATNLLQNIDEALFRRISVVAKFPSPNAVDRERIFRAHLTTEAPLSEDLDLAFLAARLEVSGGHIKNIVLAAAYLAANEGLPIGMSHMVRSASQELQKIGKILIKESFAPYFNESN
jgi:hypothetical protein